MIHMTKNAPPQALSPILKKLREAAREHGLTAYALAKVTGHSISTCQRAMDGEVSPSLATVEAIAKALGHVIKLEKKP